MNTQLTPEDFRARLDAALQEPQDFGHGQAVEADIALGRRMLRRRRGTVALGAVSLVAVAGLAGGTVFSSDDPGTRTTSVATAPRSEASVAPEAAVLSRDGAAGTLAELVGGATVVEEWSGAGFVGGSVVRGDATYVVVVEYDSYCSMKIPPHSAQVSKTWLRQRPGLPAGFQHVDTVGTSECFREGGEASVQVTITLYSADATTHAEARQRAEDLASSGRWRR